MWDTQTRECIHTLQIPEGYYAIGGELPVSATWLAVLVTTTEGNICNILFKEGRFHGFLGGNFVPKAFSVDGKLLAASYSGDSTRILDTAALTSNTRPPDEDEPIFNIIFSPASNLIVSNDRSKVKLWNVLSGVCRGPLALPAGVVIEEVAVAEGAPLVALSLRNRNRRFDIQIWNLNSGKCAHTLMNLHGEAIPDWYSGRMTLSRNGETMAFWTA